MSAPSFVGTIVFFVGLIALFVGERLFGTGTGRTVASAIGALLVLGAIGLRAARMARAAGERKRVERWLLGLYLLAVAALLLYVAQSDLWVKLTGSALERGSPKLAGALGALWPALMTLSILPVLLVEMSYAAMQRAPEIEAGRVKDALLSGVGVACALIFALCAYYVAAERDTRWDFSYFRTAKPGEATRNIVRALEEDVTVSVFFPPANDVRVQVMEYLSDLKNESDRFVIQSYDHALEPARARELGVTGNGTIVVQRGERKELMGIGQELEKARTQLRNLDQEFQRRLLTVARPRRTIYFTTGHGERSADRAGATDQRWTIRALRELYGEQNHDVRNLSAVEGLASEVPQDAAAVVIIGPTKPFLPEELSALQRYLDRGGRVMLALDPEAKLDFTDLLAPYGLKYTAVTLANEESNVARTRQAPDRLNLLTAAFSSHPSVTSLGRMGQRAPVVFVGAGFIEAPQRPPNVRLDFTVHSHPATWNDENGNFQLDPPLENKRVFELAAAVSRTDPNAPKPAGGGAANEARMLVFADSDALTDVVIENLGNAYLALDGMKWLLGEEAIAGAVNTEEDKPITATRAQDKAWFFSTIFLAPAAVIGFGLWFTRNRGRRSDRRAVEAKS